MNTLHKVTVHTLSGTEQDDTRSRHATQKSTRFKLNLFHLGIPRLVCSNCSWSQITETWESETTDESRLARRCPTLTRAGKCRPDAGIQNAYKQSPVFFKSTQHATRSVLFCSWWRLPQSHRESSSTLFHKSASPYRRVVQSCFPLSLSSFAVIELQWISFGKWCFTYTCSHGSVVHWAWLRETRTHIWIPSLSLTHSSPNPEDGSYHLDVMRELNQLTSMST